jgi:hypothetical protein
MVRQFISLQEHEILQAFASSGPRNQSPSKPSAKSSRAKLIPGENASLSRPAVANLSLGCRFGRAFRDQKGLPVLYSGIVVSVAAPDAGGSLAH